MQSSNLAVAFKSNVLSIILEDMFASSFNTITNELSNIKIAQMELMPGNYGSFTYKGLRYDLLQHRVVSRWLSPVPLIASLHDQMDAYLLLLLDTVNDRNKVTSYIQRVLNVCYNTKDVITLLPEVIVKILPSVIEASATPYDLSITEKSILAFNIENAEYIDLIKYRYVCKLLAT